MLSPHTLRFSRCSAAALLAALAGAPLPGLAACPATPESLSAELELATEAFIGMDAAAFAEARESARASLACMDRRAPPALAGAYHRMEALDAYLTRNFDGTRAAFRAALTSAPDYALPPELAPEGNRLSTLYEEARTLSDPEVAVAIPEGFTLVVDGSEKSERPESRPAIYQGFTTETTPLWTDWLKPEAPLPDWGPPPTVERPERSGGGLLWSAAGVAVVSGGLWTGALINRGKALDYGDQISNDALDASESGAVDTAVQRARWMGYAAQATTGAAAGLGVAGVVVRW